MFGVLGVYNFASMHNSVRFWIFQLTIFEIHDPKKIQFLNIFINLIICLIFMIKKNTFNFFEGMFWRCGHLSFINKGEQDPQIWMPESESFWPFHIWGSCSPFCFHHLILLCFYFIFWQVENGITILPHPHHQDHPRMNWKIFELQLVIYQTTAKNLRNSVYWAQEQLNQITKVIEVKFFFLIRQLSSSGQMVIRQLLAVVMQSLDSFQAVVKGQLISKCLLSDIVSTKKPTNFF